METNDELVEKIELAKKYITALLEAVSDEDFCALVDAGKLDGIRAFLEEG